jgi:hypothetical protein
MGQDCSVSEEGINSLHLHFQKITGDETVALTMIYTYMI